MEFNLAKFEKDIEERITLLIQMYRDEENVLTNCESNPCTIEHDRTRREALETALEAFK